MKIGIFYGTLTLNTQMVADSMYEYLKKKGKDIEVFNVNQVDNPKFLNDFDLIIFGTSTWADGDYAFDMAEFMENLDSVPKSKMKLKNKKFAFFGLGESHYEYYCEAAIKAKQKFVNDFGVEHIGEILKIDGYPEDETLQASNEWALNICKLVVS